MVLSARLNTGNTSFQDNGSKKFVYIDLAYARWQPLNNKQWALTFTGGLQGTGDTRSPLYITLVSQVALPMGICFCLQATGNLTPAGVWTAIVVGHATRCALSIWRFQQGRWKTIKVD